MNTPTHYHPVTGMLYWFDGSHWVYSKTYRDMYGKKFTRIKQSGMKDGFMPLTEEGLTIGRNQYEPRPNSLHT